MFAYVCIYVFAVSRRDVDSNQGGTDSGAVAQTLPEKETPETDEDVEGDDF